MLSAQKKDNHLSSLTEETNKSTVDIENFLSKEWLLTNKRGGFSGSSILGVNTRRYHGLLTGSLNPPANRVNSLNCVLETVSSTHGQFDFSSFEFDSGVEFQGQEFITGFYKDHGVHFKYDLNWLDITKSVYLCHDRDAVFIVYEFSNVYNDFDFSVRPLAAMRDFHSLQRSNTHISGSWRCEGVVISGPDHNLGELYLSSSQMWFEKDPQWWYNFKYRKDSERGQGCSEDLWSPGMFKCRIEGDCRIVFKASLGECGTAHELLDIDEAKAIESISQRHQETLGKSNDKHIKALSSAASQFVIERDINGKKVSSILAGYPWFMDWGRDAFIALPGLLLSTERYTQAAEVLTTFASAISKGMIPNRFDDYGADPHYNSIDASLWFINSAFEYLHETKDAKTFDSQLLPAVEEIIENYKNGTRFGIHADTDGLITGGDAETQLTWMDAKCNGVTFTPRYGKAVEINALWYSALCSLAEHYRENIDKSDEYRQKTEYYGEMAQQVSESFCKLFWNEDLGYLNDCILPDGMVDSSLRPNQIYAVALPFSPLEKHQQSQVVQTVQDVLLTDYGLRTLSPDDPRYHGRYQGSMFERDAAYHQGTVWPHLIGPFIEAFLWVNGLEKQHIRKAQRFLKPLTEKLSKDGCIGSIAEIYDGDAPQNPRGCLAQAWAVAEVLRVYKLLSEL